MAVTAEGRDLIEVDPISHTDVDRGLFDKLPLESQSSSLSSLVTLSAPGTSADSNGLFHGFGDHASNSFSVDGQTITDQQSKVFSNQIPLDSVQSMEVIQGAPPAEYGDKTSLVIVVTTRSGLGVDHAHGEVTGSYGTFGTGSGGFNLAYGGKSWGNFISANGMNTGRFLDGPEFAVMHDHGNQGNLFDRVDFKPSQSDTININLGFTRSWFQTPNSYDAQIRHSLVGIGCRQRRSRPQRPGGRPTGSAVQNQYVQHRADMDASGQRPYPVHARRLCAAGPIQLLPQRQSLLRPHRRSPKRDRRPEPQPDEYRRPRGSLVRERAFTTSRREFRMITRSSRRKTRFGIVDPTLNPPCLNADGSPFTDPSLTDPAGCTGDLQPNPDFRAATGVHRLDANRNITRQRRLPQFNRCLV